MLAEILVDLLKLTAPVLVYTADEAWQFLPAHLKERNNVHLTLFPPSKPHYVLSEAAVTNWDELLRMRGVVSKELEDARRQGIIGSSLEAAVTLIPGDARTERILQEYEAQLPWVFIVFRNVVLASGSQAELGNELEQAAANEDRLLVKIERAPGKKCVRCWNYREDVGTKSDHPLLCTRCVEQLGEVAG